MSAEGVGAVLEAVAAYVEAVQRDREADEAVEQAYFRGSDRRAASIARAQFGDTESPLIETTDRLLALDPAHLRALAAGQAEAGAGAEMPTQAELDAVRGYLIDVRSGSHTMGNLRHFANRHEHGHPSDIPEHWAGTPDDAHVTKGMHAHVLWRAFRRARLAALAPADAPAAQDGAGGRA